MFSIGTRNFLVAKIIFSTKQKLFTSAKELLLLVHAKKK